MDESEKLQAEIIQALRNYRTEDVLLALANRARGTSLFLIEVGNPDRAKFYAKFAYFIDDAKTFWQMGTDVQ